MFYFKKITASHVANKFAETAAWERAELTP
jgi:hypothetical protein